MKTNTQNITDNQELNAYQAAAGFQENKTPEPETSSEASPTREQTVRKLMNEAFEAVATDFNCLLPELLTETRRRGVTDEEVRHEISEDETCLAQQCGTEDCEFQCWRNARGVGYIARTNGTSQSLASIGELFGELKPERETSSHDLVSDRLRDRGEQLTELEAIILDACQTLHRKFRHGETVSTKQAQRVVMKYHPGMATCAEFKAAVAGLSKRRLCLLEPEGFRLVNHFGAPQEPLSQSRFAALTREDRLIQVLIACDHCVGVGFDTAQNVSQRSAVAALCRARHGLSNFEFKKRIKLLKDTSILEEVTSKGAAAFRLTIEACVRMRARKSMKGPIPSRFDELQALLTSVLE